MQNIYFYNNLNFKTWFKQIEDLCCLYNLPNCLEMLDIPIEKGVFKKMVKNNIIDYWQQKLRNDAKQLPSLKYFKPDFYSLAFPSRAYEAAGAS